MNKLLTFLSIVAVSSCISMEKFNETSSFSLASGEKVALNYDVRHLALPFEETQFNLYYTIKNFDNSFVTINIVYENLQSVPLASNDDDINVHEKSHAGQSDRWSSKSVCFRNSVRGQESHNYTGVITIIFTAKNYSSSSKLEIQSHFTATGFQTIELNKDVEVTLQPGKFHLFRFDLGAPLNESTYLMTKLSASSSFSKSVVLFQIGCPEDIIVPDQNQRIIAEKDYLQRGFVIVAALLDNETSSCKQCFENQEKNNLTIRVIPQVYNPPETSSKTYIIFTLIIFILLVVIGSVVVVGLSSVRIRTSRSVVVSNTDEITTLYPHQSVVENSYSYKV